MEDSYGSIATGQSVPFRRMFEMLDYRRSSLALNKTCNNVEGSYKIGSNYTKVLIT